MEKRIVQNQEISVAYYDYLPEGANGLTRSQAREALFDAGQNPIKQDIDDFWNLKHKKDGDVITLDELEELNNRLGDPKQVIKDALVFFDKDKNGKMDRNELHDILRLTDQFDHGFDDGAGYIDHILKLGDKDGDNMVDIDDLVMMIQDGLLTVRRR